MKVIFNNCTINRNSGHRSFPRLGFLSFLLASVLFGTTAYSLPNWAKQTQKKMGPMFYVVCSGEGPSLDLARLISLHSCKNTASDQFVSEITVKTMTIETERDTAFHKEINQNIKAVGLICQPEQESIEENDGFFKVWMQCKFDLSQAKVIDINEKIEQHRNEYISGETKQLTISTIPKCDDILIRGDKPRVVECKSNPIILSIDPKDNELIIRAKGFKPKTIYNNGGLGNDKNIQIRFNY